MFVDVDHQIEQLEQLFQLKVAMQNHEAELLACIFVEFEDCFVAAVGVGLDHYHVVVVEEAHYEALVHLDVGLG